jgi:aminopeptidase
LPATTIQKQRLGDLLYDGDPLKRSPLIVNLCDYGRGIGEQIVARCVADNLDAEITFDDPWFHRAMLNSLDNKGIERYALWRAARTGEVDRRIGMRVTNVSLPLQPVEDYKEKNKLYNATVAGMRRTRTRDPFFTVTVLPVPEDAEIDQIPYPAYVDLFLRMCNVDWKEVDKAHRVLIEKLDKGSILHFTNNDGTDLMMDVTGMTFANSLVAKNVPGSEVFSSPLKNSVNGKIVAKGRFIPKGTSELVEDMVLVFKDGKIIDFSAQTGQEILAEFVNVDDGSCYIGEIGIGTNPVLQQHIVNSLLVEKIGGSFHVALGQAYTFTEYLGTPVKVDNGNRSQIHWDVTTMLVGKEGRITVDGEIIMENGKFVDTRLNVLNGTAA